MIEVSNIKKSYGRNQVLKDISFSVNPGEKIVIVGMNGCGKSTLLQIMAGVLKADGGYVKYFGQDVNSNTKIFRQFVGYVPQENPLLEELSVRDNLKLWKYRDLAIKEMIEKQFELDEIMKKKVRDLSGGMKRRLSIACALMQWPPILLLDEPASGLDLYYKDSISTWMKDYCKNNGIVIMASHEDRDILSADRCLFMQDGVLSDLGKITDVDKVLEGIKSGKQ